VLYAVNNVAQEALVRGKGGPVEYLGSIGGFGVLVSLVQVAALEWDGARQLLGVEVSSADEGAADDDHDRDGAL